MRSPISSPLALRRFLISANGCEACSRSAIMIMAKNSWSVVCEMSTMLAWASASTADTAAMIPTWSCPMTVTMMRLVLGGMAAIVPLRSDRAPGQRRQHPRGADEDDDAAPLEELGLAVQLR